MSSPQKILEKNRSDLSQFLIHLTKEGRYRRYSPGRVRGHIYNEVIVRAEHSLQGILANKMIEARSPYGYFKLKIDFPTQARGGVHPDWVKSVCFSESPLKEIKNFYDAVVAKRNDYKKFGLGFWQERVRTAGANPVLYVDSNKPQLLVALDSMAGANAQMFQSMMPFYDTFGPLVLHTNSPTGFSDFRWEREWRFHGDFTFDWKDVAFGICPANQIKQYEALAQSQIVFLDPDWDELTLRRYLAIKNANQLLAAL